MATKEFTQKVKIEVSGRVLEVNYKIRKGRSAETDIFMIPNKQKTRVRLRLLESGRVWVFHYKPNKVNPDPELDYYMWNSKEKNDWDKITPSCLIPVIEFLEKEVM